MFNFPSSPIEGALFTPAGGPTYLFHSGAWDVAPPSVSLDLTVTGNATIGGTLGVTGATTLGTLGVTDNTTVGGTLGVTGTTTLGTTALGTTTVSGNLTPNVTAIRDLGSASLRWGTIYTSDLSLKNDVGDWTIVEGADDLFITNNRNGKRYRFALMEVEDAN